MIASITNSGIWKTNAKYAMRITMRLNVSPSPNATVAASCVYPVK
jgi:hypothetical protein